MSKFIILFSALILSLSAQAKVLKCDWRVQSNYEMDLEQAPTFSFLMNLENGSAEEQIQKMELHDRLIEAKIRLNSYELREHDALTKFSTRISIYFKNGYTRTYPTTMELSFQDNTVRNFFTVSEADSRQEHSVNLACTLFNETR